MKHTIAAGLVPDLQPRRLGLRTPLQVMGHYFEYADLFVQQGNLFLDHNNF
jgi:hypothetical protein